MNYLIYSVEDDKNISHLINVALSKQGYVVESFYDGESFLRRFKEQKPNLILLDMMLPNIQGGEILKTIRDNDENDDIQIIIVSANRMVMDKVDGLDLGADDYIEKPFDILELMSRVNSKARRFFKKQRIVRGNLILDSKTSFPQIRLNNSSRETTSPFFFINNSITSNSLFVSSINTSSL